MTNAIRILGLDPGLRRTGWGVIAVDGSRLIHIAHGVIAPKETMAFSDRLLFLFESVGAVIAEHAPHEAAIEETFMTANGQSTLKLGHARAAAMIAPARAAGFRTHTLVALASAILMLAAQHQVEWASSTTPEEILRIDPVRMAHGILTGVGFLCGGVIFKEGLSVHGLTTAASLWITSALCSVSSTGTPTGITSWSRMTNAGVASTAG